MKISQSALRSFSLGHLEAEILQSIERLEQDRVLQRLFSKDPTLWDRFNFSESELHECLDWTDTFKRAKSALNSLQFTNSECSTVVLIGMGGSSLAAQVYDSVCRTNQELEVFSSTSPGALLKFLEKDDFDYNNFQLIVSSKSGSTIETISIAETLYEVQLSNRLSQKQFCVITDESQSHLREWAEAKGFRIFNSNRYVPGRYSALSILGLVPAAMLGCDIDRIFETCETLAIELASNGTEHYHVASVLAAALSVLSDTAGGEIVLEVPCQLIPLARWIEQLVAESLGKNGRGVLPVIKITPHSGKQIDVVAKSQGQHSSIYSTNINDEADLAETFLTWQTATVAAGWLMGINPFNQPDVEESKVLVRDALKGTGKFESGTPSNIHAHDFAIHPTDDSVKACVSAMTEFQDSNFFSIMAFVEPTNEIERALYLLSEALSQLVNRTVVYNFGPQYLHSTGQFHKGGPKTGTYLILTADHPADLQVSGQTYSFGELSDIQAAIDADLLKTTGQEVYRLKLVEDSRACVDLLAQEIKARVENQSKPCI